MASLEAQWGEEGCNLQPPTPPVATPLSGSTEQACTGQPANDLPKINLSALFSVTVIN